MVRSVLRCVLVLAVLLPLAGCKSDEEKINDFMAQGLAYVEEGKLDEAMIEFRNTIQIDPNHPQAHYELAKAFIEKQNFKKAYWELSESVRLDPSNSEARLSLAGLMFAVRDFEEAVAQLDSVIAAGTEDGAAHLVRGQALERLDRAEEAGEAYARAVEVGIEGDGVLLVYADFMRRQGDLGESERLMLEYAERQPGFRAYTALGQFYARLPEQRDQAYEALEKAVTAAEEADEVTAAYSNLAAFYYRNEEADRAIEVLSRGVEQNEDNLDLIYLLARFHRTLGNEEEADKLVEQATLAAPDQVDPLLVLSAYRGRNGDLEGALEAADAALAIDPDHRQAQLRKAELLVDAGFRSKDTAMIDEGRKIVEAILAEEPSLPSALFVMAKFALADKDPQRAVELATDAISGQPDWAQAHFVLGSALALTGDNNGARAALSRAVELDPTGLPKARSLLAKLHAALGEHEYAIDVGRAYLREVPDDNTTRVLVAQSLVRLGRVEEAFEELELIPDDARDVDALYAIGKLHQARGDTDKAYELLLAAYEQRPAEAKIVRSLMVIDRQREDLAPSAKRVAAALEQSPDAAELWSLDATLAILDRDVDRAEASLKKAIDLDPSNVEIVQQLANLYRLTGRLDETISTYKSALEARPDSAELHHFLAVLYEFGGQPDLAVQEYEAAIRYDSSLGHAKNNLAYLLAEQGESLDRALDLAQEAKALLPDNANAADTLGWVLYKRGVPSAAVGYLKEAEATMDVQDPNLGIVRHHLAMAYEASGEPDKALESLERALVDLQRAQDAARKAGRTPPEPEWADEVREMSDRLKGRATG